MFFPFTFRVVTSSITSNDVTRAVKMEPDSTSTPVFHPSPTNTTVELLDADRVDIFSIICFVWLTLASIVVTIVFLATPKLRQNRPNIIAFNLIISVIIHEMLFSSTLIYHDLKGHVFSWTFGLHSCRLCILAHTFAIGLLSYTILAFTADALLHVVLLSRHSANTVSRWVFVATVISPWVLAALATTISIFPFCPNIGRLLYHKSLTGQTMAYCILDYKHAYLRRTMTVTSVTAISVLPGSVAVLLACVLMYATYRHLSTYQTMSFGDNPLGDGRSRIQQIAIATFCMNLLHVAMTGPYHMAKYGSSSRNLHDLYIGCRVFLGILPIVWFCIQPELLPLIVAAGRRCMKGRHTDEIREYNAEKQDSVELT